MVQPIICRRSAPLESPFNQSLFSIFSTLSLTSGGRVSALREQKRAAQSNRNGRQRQLNADMPRILAGGLKRQAEATAATLMYSAKLNGIETNSCH